MKAAPDWTQRARELLDHDTEQLDAATLSRLNQARQRALLLASPARTRLYWPRRLAVAASLLLAAAIWWPGSPGPGSPTAATLSPEDAELLAEGELEMTDELEFYAWLDADAEHNG